MIIKKSNKKRNFSIAFIIVLENKSHIEKQAINIGVKSIEGIILIPKSVGIYFEYIIIVRYPKIILPTIVIKP